MPEPDSLANPNAPAQTPLKSHLPSLDGVRAFSILLVILAHSSGALRRFAFFNDFGTLGVCIFFVISGMLITWLMIRERDATGNFSLRDFYIRRFLRIIPAFWLLILVVTLLRAAGQITISWVDIARSFTFTHDYPLSLVHPHEFPYAWWLGHTWSLSVEEQFYLIWPALFAFLPGKYSPRLALIMMFSGPFLRIANYYFFPALRGYEGDLFHTRIDILMAGCAAAYLLESPGWSRRIKKVPVWPVVAVAGVLLFLVDPALSSHLTFHSHAQSVFGMVLPTVETFAIVVTLLVLVAGRPGAISRLLNLGFVRHIGRLSYSLYLWQQLFLGPGSAPTIFSLLIRLAGIYLAALCSYYFLELPLIGLRRKFRHGVSV